jgi:hypothetical protein
MGLGRIGRGSQSNVGADRRDVERRLKKSRHGAGDWIISQVMRILCLMLGALNDHIINSLMHLEWLEFLPGYHGCWSSRLQIGHSHIRLHD